MPIRSEELELVPIGLTFIVAMLLVSILVFVPGLIAARRTVNKQKDSPYECGMPASPITPSRFSIKFYLIAMLFILFDIEVVFLFGWASVFRDLVKPASKGGIGSFMLWQVILFIVILEVGHLYIVKRGVLHWAPQRPHKDD